jgi:hypothetical protein
MKATRKVLLHSVLALLILPFALFIASCRPSADVMPLNSKVDTGLTTYTTTSDRWGDIFATFWYGMSANYVFWDIQEPGYWDSVWDTYKPKFDALGKYEDDPRTGLDVTDLTSYTAKQRTALTYFKQMLRPLKDGHLKLYFQPSPAYGTAAGYISPASDRISTRFSGNTDDTDASRALPIGDAFADNPGAALQYWYSGTSWGVIGNYVNQTTGNYAGAVVSPEGENKALRMFLGKVNNNLTGLSGEDFLLYFYFSNFYLIGQALQTASPANADFVQHVLNDYFAWVSSPHCRGVIFDVRSNSGGSTPDIVFLLGPLLTGKHQFAWTRTKDTMSPQSYTPWMPYFLYPTEYPNRAFKGMDMISQPNPNIGGNFPIVALVNDFSISYGEIFPIAVKSLRNGYLVGTQTWGATGPHYQEDSPGWTNGGCFTHNKFWTQVYETGYELRALDFTSYEGVGVPPDKKVPFSYNAFTDSSSPTDAQLQAAIAAASAYIKSGVYPAP